MRIFTKILCSATITINTIIPINANAATADISINDSNIINITATDVNEGDTILWSCDRYRAVIDGTAVTDYNNIYWNFKMLGRSDEVNIQLIPTGRFRENTEVIIFGNYFLMAEPENMKSSIRGDINNDNKHNIADLVLLQNYIYNNINFTTIEKGRADMTNDKIIDSFDLVMMRKMLVE